MFCHKRTIFFLIEVGLRQGCLLSPILFDLFINDLSKVINALEKGVKCGNRDVSNLFFADDIAVIADSKEDLEVILQTIYDFSLKWRFKFNIDKCSVVVFDNKRHDSLSVGDCKSECKCNHHFRFGPFLIQEVLMYKYLGVELDNRLTYSFFKNRMLQKARMNVGRVWHMGIRNNLVSVKGGMNMYEALVSSILEFSCIIWAKGDWRDAETLQRNMFKKILKCSVMTTGETVLGDLGRWQLRARRDFLVLQYWFQLISCPDSRLLKQAYLMSKGFANVKKRNFASRCKNILFKYNLRNLWYNEQLIYNLDGKNNNESKTISSHKHFFENYMTKIIHGYEERHWRERMDKISKLRTYRYIKRNLCFEKYLNTLNCQGRSLMFSIRSGTNKLEIERGRWVHKPEMQRVCKHCSLNQVENEVHFVTICPKYQDLREQLFQKILTGTGGKWDFNNLPVRDAFCLLLKGTSDTFEPDIFKLVQFFLIKAYRRREVEMKKFK